MNTVVRLLASLALAAPALTAAPAAFAERVGHYHVMPTPDYIARSGRAPQAGSMLYYGGSVFSSVRVISVIWGAEVNPVTVAGIPGFSTALVDSSYVDQLSEYDTFLTGVNGHRGTRQHIQRGSYGGQVQIVPQNTATKLSDKQVQQELRHQIAIGALPPQDLNTLYMVYFPRNVTITLQGLTSCRDFGAYHFATNDQRLARNNLFYSVEPDCGYSFPTITYIASHEYAEATTDNVPTPGTVPDFPQAWNTADGWEIADVCSGSGTLFAPGASYTVTQVYLNSRGGCSVGDYTSP